MSSLIELNEGDSNKRLKNSSKAVHNAALKRNNLTVNGTLQPKAKENHCGISGPLDEKFNSSNLKNKRHTNVSAYSNKINFNYSPDMIKRKESTQQQQEPSIVWSKLKTLSSNSNIDFNVVDLSANESINSNKISTSSLNTLNRNDVTTANLAITSNFNQIIQKSISNKEERKSFSQTNDDIIQMRNENSVNPLAVDTQPEAIVSSSLRIFSLCCKSKSNDADTKNKAESYKIRFLSESLRKMLTNLRANILGLGLSIVISISFVLMTFLLKNSLNLIELSKVQTLSKTDNETSYVNETLNVEMKRSKLNLNCDFCFLIIWTTTSCLVFVYPVFFIFYCSTYKKKTKNNKRVLIMSKKSQESFANIEEATTKQRRRRQRLNSPYMLLLSDSLKIFNSKKKRDANNLSSNSSNNNSNCKNEVSDLEHLKMKRYLFLKMIGVTFLWVLTGYSYIRAINVLYSSDVVILFSVNFAFVFIASWIILHNKFIPIKVWHF